MIFVFSIPSYRPIFVSLATETLIFVSSFSTCRDDRAQALSKFPTLAPPKFPAGNEKNKNFRYLGKFNNSTRASETHGKGCVGDR